MLNSYRSSSYTENIEDRIIAGRNPSNLKVKFYFRIFGHSINLYSKPIDFEIIHLLALSSYSNIFHFKVGFSSFYISRSSFSGIIRLFSELKFIRQLLGLCYVVFYPELKMFL